MNILVTGGAGYIGSHTITNVLEKRDYAIYSLDNYSNSGPQTYERIADITGRRVTAFECDLRDYDALCAVFEQLPQIDGIIHFAALKAVGESMEEPLLYYDNNLGGMINLLRCVDRFNVPNFIFSSSCTLYGNVDELPASEDSPLKSPESPYGYTKSAGERILQDFIAASPEHCAISLRYFNPVGAHGSGKVGELPLGKPNNLVPIITQFASGWLDQLVVYGEDYPTRDGTAVRDYVHVTDIAHAHLLALEHITRMKDDSHYDVFNLGTGEGVTVLEAIRAFEERAGLKLDFRIGARRPGDIAAIYADNRKAREVLGWQPGLSIGDAMESAWKWQQHLNSQKQKQEVEA